MAPLVRRTWAPRGMTPILAQRTRSRQKVSAIAALTLAPRRRRVGLYFSLYPDANIAGGPHDFAPFRNDCATRPAERRLCQLVEWFNAVGSGNSGARIPEILAT